jgi:hypothetical protein
LVVDVSSGDFVSSSQDIIALFRRFGGNADAYQEIVSNDQARAAEQNWPMLGERKPLAGAEAPDVKRVAPVGARLPQGNVSGLMAHKTLSQSARVAPAVSLPQRTLDTPPAETIKAVVAVAKPDVQNSDLKSMFNRIAAPAVEPARDATAPPRKRSIKW